MGWRGLWLGLLLSALAAVPARAADFGDWAAVVVAGDWRASEGAATEAFDNARRDVARTLETAGFRRDNIRQFSTRPQRYADTRPQKAEPRAIYEALSELTGRAKGGCLVYFSSHGSPEGVVVDDRLLAPQILARMVKEACAERPTIVVISACFSGVFVPALAEPNHMVLTAARRDRTSFGCGVDNVYPFFDDCFLSSAPEAHDFLALGQAVRTCVAAREVKEKMTPPSEPQLFVGAALRPVLPLYGLKPKAAAP